MKCKFGDVVINFDRQRVPLSASERKNRKGIYRYYGAQGVIDNIDDYIFDGEYMLVAEDGENVKSQKQNIAQMVSGRFWVNNHAHILQSNGLSDLRYLCYVLNLTDISGYVTGSAQPKLNQANLNAIELDLPDLDTQRAIATILTALDDKIANNTKINQHLEQIAQAIFKSWFVDFEPWGGVMPDYWQKSNIGIVCDVKGGKRLPKGENLTTIPNTHPYIRVRDMNDALFVQKTSSIEYVPEEIQSSISRYIVSSNDIIISIVGTIGLVCIIHSSLDKANLTENCVKLTNYNGVSPSWVYLLLSSDNGQEQIRNVTVGAVQPKLPIKNIQNISFALPPLNVMKEFNGIVSGLFDSISNNCAENTRLVELRDALLPRLMSGEISVVDI